MSGFGTDTDTSDVEDPLAFLDETRETDSNPVKTPPSSTAAATEATTETPPAAPVRGNGTDAAVDPVDVPTPATRQRRNLARSSAATPAANHVPTPSQAPNAANITPTVSNNPSAARHAEESPYESDSAASGGGDDSGGEDKGGQRRRRRKNPPSVEFPVKRAAVPIEIIVGKHGHTAGLGGPTVRLKNPAVATPGASLESGPVSTGTGAQRNELEDPLSETAFDFLQDGEPQQRDAGSTAPSHPRPVETGAVTNRKVRPANDEWADGPDPGLPSRSPGRPVRQAGARTREPHEQFDVTRVGTATPPRVTAGWRKIGAGIAVLFLSLAAVLFGFDYLADRRDAGDSLALTDPDAGNLAGGSVEGPSVREQADAMTERLDNLISNGQLDEAEDLLKSIDLVVYGYGKPEFDIIEETIGLLRGQTSSVVATDADTDADNSDANDIAKQAEIESAAARDLLEEQRLETERAERELAEQQRADAEAKRIAEETRLLQEEADRIAAETEAARLAAIADEQRRAAEAAQRQAEELRVAEEQRLAAEREAAELAEKQRQLELAAEEEKRRLAEAQRIAAERQAELDRQAEQQRQEKLRLEAERVEAERQAELQRQEQARLEAERQAELQRQEQARLEAERQAELQRQEQARLEAERQAELQRQEQARLEAERQAELQRQEQARLEAERQAELQRQEQVRLEAERQAELRQQEARLEAARQAEVQRLEQARLEAERQAEELAARRAAEQRAAFEAARIENERRQAALVRERVAEEKRNAERNRQQELAQQRARLRERAAAEQARLRQQQQAAAEQRTQEQARQRAAEQQAAASTVQPKEITLTELVQPDVQPRARADTPISDRELERVYRRFQALEQALESKDMNRVVELTAQSSTKIGVFLQLFQNFESMDIRIEDVSASNASSTVSGRLRIKSMTRENGDKTLPSDSWRDTLISSKRAQDGQWSPINW